MEEKDIHEFFEKGDQLSLELPKSPKKEIAN